METSKKVLKCDVCGKTAEAEDTSYFGGHPWQGWFVLKERGGSTMLEELQRKKNWDICSVECLAKFSKTPAYRKQKKNKISLTPHQKRLAKEFGQALTNAAKRVKKVKK